LVIIVHQPTACSATSLCLPLVVSSAASVGDLAMVAPGMPRPTVALLESPAPEEPMSEVLVALV
jgi:hypothetical protein